MGYAPRVAGSRNPIVALLPASDPRGCSTNPSGPGGPGGPRTLCMEGNSCHLVVIVCSCNSASSPTLDQIYTLMVPLWWGMGTQILKGFVALLGGEKSHGSKTLPSASSSNSGGLAWLNVPSLNLRTRRTIFSRSPVFPRAQKLFFWGNALVHPHCIQMLPLQRDTIN